MTQRFQGTRPWLLSVILMLPAVPAPMHAEDLVLVSIPSDSVRRSVASSGQVLKDYGAFVLARPKPGLVLPGGEPVNTALEVRGLRFDPLKEAPPALPHQKATAKATHDARGGLYLLQFIGPVTDEWRASVEKKGVEILQYVPHNGFLVRSSAEALQAASSLSFVRASAPYTSALKLAPALREPLGSQGSSRMAIDIQLVKGASTASLEERLQASGGRVVAFIRPPGNFFDVLRAEILVSEIASIAAETDVLGIDPYIAPTAEDERAAQAVAGNYSSVTVLNGPGYTPLSQFGADGTGVTVAVVDDGIGIPGDGGFYVTAGNAADAPLRGAPAGADGHGHLNATIIAGTTPYAPILDPLGYNYGAGISPKAHVTNIPLLRTGYVGTEADTANDAVTTAGPNGVAGFISSNSWGAGTNGNAYDSMAAQYDGFVRDASSGASLDPLLIVFSAGNSGTSGLTRPKVAKNVISVAAGENIRPELSPYGGNPNDNIDEISSYSSRGLAADGRVKPDLSAPGTAITGGRSGPDSLFGNIDTYHRWSTGTSHACPQISGAAALFVQWWKAGHGGSNPSPAIVKAALINGTVPMAGGGAGGAIPNGSQGWGRVNLKRILSTGVQMTYVDQTSTLTSPGEITSISGSVSSDSAPFRVSLVWTDPPGLSDPALVNNLDLEVIVGGVTYKGNVLSGGVSVSGGSADSLNNVENVFLGAGIASGTPYTIRVIAIALNGDGVPGNADSTDQHFALVVHNGSSCPAPSSTITPPAYVCKGSSGNVASVPAGADSYVWAITNGSITAGQGSNSISFSAGTTGPVGLSVTVTKNSCSSNGAAQVPVVSAAISAPAVTCANATGNVASAMPGASSYAWTISNGTITSGQGTNTIVFTAGTSGNVTLGLSITQGACSDTSGATVPISAAGTLTVSAPAIVCPASTGNGASASGASGVFNWTITNGTITGGQGTASISFTAGTSGAVDLSVATTQGACAFSGARSVPIDAPPAATITAPASACPNGTGMTASAPTGALTYSWSILNGSITAGQGTRQITFSVGFSGSTILSLVVSNSNCSATSLKDIPIITPTAPPAALLPVNAATGYSGGFVSWSHAGGVPYDVYFDTVTPPQKKLGTFTSNSAALPVWFPSTTYYWQVVAKEPCGSVPSANFSFTTGTCSWTGATPLLTTPIDNATGVTASGVAFSWQAVAGTAYYALHLSTAASPQTFRTIPVPQTSITVTLNPGTPYFWKVVAYPVCGTGAATVSATRRFTTTAGVTSITNVLPALLNRWTGGSLNITGSGLLGKVFSLDLAGQSGGAFTVSTASSTAVSGTVDASTSSPSGRYDLVVKENSVERVRVPAAVVLRAFTDVTETDFFFHSSARVADAGIMETDADTVNVGPQFSPAVVLTRAKMAEYLAKAYQWWRTRSTAPPAATCVVQGTGSADFPDVPCDHPQWIYIHWIKEWGVTTGAPCDQGFCFFPANSLNRAEMVTFLERLKQGGLLPTLLTGPGETDPGCSQPYPACSGWTDAGMKVATWPRREANVTFGDRLTAGCAGSPGNGLAMCPFDTVTRAQVGEFLARAIGLVPNP